MKTILSILLALGVWSASATAAESVAPPQLTIPYQMPRDAAMSLGLFDKEGRLLRWLRMNEFARQGANAAPWDGLDQWGEPVPAGEYVLRGIYHGPLSLSHRATANNPGNPPWPTADGRGDWLSDEASPQAAVTDGEWVFLGAPGAEDGSSIIAVDAEGQRRWGYMFFCYPSSIALAQAGDYVYALYSGPESQGQPREYPGGKVVNRALLLCLDKKTGAPARFSMAKPQLKIFEWPYDGQYRYLWEMRGDQSFTPKEYGGQPRYFCNDVAEPAGASGLAAVGDKLYISILPQNKILEFDAATGAATGVEIPVTEPGALHRLSDSQLLSVSGRQIALVNLLTKKVTPLITSGLAAPAGVTTDRRGDLYVSDWGDSFQVKQFDRAGKFIKAIGKKGGRPWVGKWDTGGMLLPRGIAVTDSGRLWVAEDDVQPRRVSVWNAANGAFVREYVGPASYGGAGYSMVNPLNLSEAFNSGARFKVDYEKKTATPTDIMFRRRNVDDVFTPNAGGNTPMTRLVAHGKDQYALFWFNRSAYSIMKREDGRFRPVAAVGHRIKLSGEDGTGIVEWDSDIGRHRFDNFYPPVFRPHANENYCWADLNGDGLVQAEELRWYPSVPGPAADGQANRPDMYWGTNLAPDMSFFWCTTFADCKAVLRLEPEWRGDVPVYDFAKAKIVARLKKELYLLSLHVTRDEKILAFIGYENSREPNVIECYDYAGKNLWNLALPKKLAGDYAVHGSGLAYDYEIPGLGVVCLTWNWHGSYRSYMFTSSGDYLWSPLDDSHNAGPLASWGESFRGGVQDARDGTPYLLNGASGQLHILQINGLEKDAVGRFETPLKLSAADVETAAAARAVPSVSAAPRPLLGVTWRQAAPPVVVDGNLDDWNLNDSVSVEGEQGRRAVVALRRDRTHLYLAYQVFEPAPLLRNAGTDWQRLFMTGDCVDLMLATNPQADPHRRAAAEGDLRLLLSESAGQPVAVLYRPVVPGTKEPVRLMAASLDRVERLPNAKIATSRNAGDGYYVIEAAVPLADLGVDPTNTNVIRGDVGVVFADATGRSRSQRRYYYNHSEATRITEDLTTEATLQPAEWGNITLPLGENLITDGGFETPLADDDLAGWKAFDNHNGAGVELNDSVAFAGRHSARFFVTEPLDIPEEAFTLPDFNAFLRAARGGTNTAGQIAAGVTRRVPVIPGRNYSVRYRYRTRDMHDGGNRPGPGRGFACLSARLNWVGTTGGANLGADLTNREEWTTVQDFGGWYISRPYTAPDKATHALLKFNIDVRAANLRSEAWLDEVEMVEVPQQP